MWQKLCEWVKCNRIIRWIFGHEDLGSFSKNLRASASSKRWVFYFLCFLIGHTLGAFILLKQFLPEHGFTISAIHLQVYFVVVAIYALISQLDVWSVQENRKFWKGEYIFFFWAMISLASFCAHFFTAGEYPVPEELLDVWYWIGGFFATSVVSAYLRLNHYTNNSAKKNDNGKHEAS